MRILRTTRNGSAANLFAPPVGGSRTLTPRPGTSVYTAPSIAGMQAWSSPGPGGVALTASGNLVVLAEPGPGPHGERGLWLTVYRLEGANLEKVTSTFHQT